MSSTLQSENRISQSAAQVLFQFLVLAILLVLLINYKGTAGLARIRQVRSTGQLTLPALQRGVPPGSSAFQSSVAYVKIVWPALIFGVLISAAARTSLSRTPLERLFGRGHRRHQLIGALAGAPLMLCSCCAAPLFPSLYRRTRNAGPALAVTLAAPLLNPASLALCFILFPVRIAGIRLAMALILVLLGSAWVGQLAEFGTLAEAGGERAGADGRWSELLRTYAHSLADVSLRTVPLILLGIWVSMWIMHRLPRHFEATGGAHAAVTIVVASLAVPLTLPTLFEIPLALSLLVGAGQAGGAAALLFAGPAVNLPSLLVVGRYAGWKLAACLALLVWSIAILGGLLAG